MTHVAALALALAASLGARPARATDWAAVWGDLERLSRMSTDSAERRTLEAELAALSTEREKRAREKHDAPEAFRARVLRAHLARIAGRPAAVNDPSSATVLDWLPGEAWLAVQVVAPGAFRERAALAALAEGDPDGRRAELARRVLHEDLLGPPLPEAEALARALLRPDRAAGPVRDLARVLVRAGRIDEAREAIARARPTPGGAAGEAELLLAEAEVELAAGADLAASRALGASYARGSTEAGLLIARRALAAGDVARARALGRAATLADGTPALGLRTWGLASLPPPWLTDEPTNP